MRTGLSAGCFRKTYDAELICSEESYYTTWEQTGVDGQPIEATSCSGGRLKPSALGTWLIPSRATNIQTLRAQNPSLWWRRPLDNLIILARVWKDSNHNIPSLKSHSSKTHELITARGQVDWQAASSPIIQSMHWVRMPSNHLCLSDLNDCLCLLQLGVMFIVMVRVWVVIWVWVMIRDMVMTTLWVKNWHSKFWVMGLG